MNWPGLIFLILVALAPIPLFISFWKDIGRRTGGNIPSDKPNIKKRVHWIGWAGCLGLPLPKCKLNRVRQASTESVNFDDLDSGIRPAVELLQKHGFKTFESCQGGKGHSYFEPTIRFHGDELDLFKAYELCEQHGMNVDCVRRVYSKERWDRLFNEIIFYHHPLTGTIYKPIQSNTLLTNKI